jgi:hypothetical protein
MTHPFDFPFVKSVRNSLQMRQIDLAKILHDKMPSDLLRGISVESLAAEISSLENRRELTLSEQRHLFILDYVRTHLAKTLEAPTLFDVSVDAPPAFLEAYDNMLRDLVKSGRIVNATTAEDVFTKDSGVYGLIPFSHDSTLQSHPVGSIFLSLFARITSHDAFLNLTADYDLSIEQAMDMLVSSGRMQTRKHPYGKSMVGRASSWRVFALPSDVGMQRTSTLTPVSVVSTPPEAPAKDISVKEVKGRQGLLGLTMAELLAFAVANPQHFGRPASNRF